MSQLTLDGRPVALIDQGDGPGRPLLLLHGFAGSKEDFDQVVEPLAGDRRVVALDLPGHGGSEGSDDPGAYGLPAQADWVLRAADALGLGELHLAGHSLGGLIAQRAASVASQRLRSLVLADTGLGALREEMGEGYARIAVAARDRGMAAAWEERRRLDAPRGVSEQDREREAFVEQRFKQLNPAAVVGEARSLISAVPAGAFLRGIDIPVLVIHGEDDDAWLANEQRLLARSIRGAEHTVVPHAAHSPHRENTDAWLKVVGEFLRRADR